MGIDDRHLMAAVDPTVTFHVGGSEDTVHDIGSDGFHDNSDSDWSTDDEGWADEVEELKENVRSR